VSRRVDALRRSWTTGPMEFPGFRLLLAGQFASSLGDLCYAVALPWLVLTRSGGPVLLGTVLACYGAARVVITPASGLIIDRFDARRLMLFTDAIRGVLVAILGSVSLTQAPSFTLLVSVAVLLGACSGLFVPASFVLLPGLLTERDLIAGNSLSTIAVQMGNLIGPALGGVLVANAGAASALLVDAVTFGLSAMSLCAVRSGARHTEELTTADDKIVGGTGTFGQVLRQGRLLHVIFLIAFAGNLIYAGASEVALPDLAHRAFGATGYGILLAALGAGMVVGALFARRGPGQARPGLLITALGLAMALAISALPFAGDLIIAALCAAVFGAGNGWSGILAISMLQIWTPRAVLGRVMSVLTLAMVGTFPISVAVTGVGVEHIGVTAFFPAAGAVMFAALSQPAFRNYRPGDHFLGMLTSTVPGTGCAPTAGPVGPETVR
jgi:predicted MFS family arabinose efflux permease